MAWVRILAQKDWPKSRYASKINRKEEAAGERERERKQDTHREEIDEVVQQVQWN